jgi:putative spermidine/putrescine transport system permease protein
MVALPLLMLFFLGLLQVSNGSFTGHLSLHGYGSVFGDRFYLFVFLRTLAIATGVTLLCLLIGYPIAYVFHHAQGWWKTAILLSVIAPLLTSTLIRTFSWMVILGRNGALNQALIALSLTKTPVEFLFTLKAVLIGMTQVLLPYMVLPIMIALDTMPPAVEEAAINLGASRWHTFWSITVPQSAPGIFGGVTLVFILGLSEFPVPMLLGGATFKVLPVYIFQTITTLLDWSRGAALASVLLIGSGLVVYLLNVCFRKLSPWTKTS